MAGDKMKIRPANRNTLAQDVKLTGRVFKSSFLKDSYMKEDCFNPANIRLLFEGRILASTACVLPRKMYFDGAELKLSGIGGVATLPEFRGRGFAGALMKNTIGYMEKQGYALSILYPYKASYYEKLGYRQVHFPFKVIDTKNAPTASPEYRIERAIIPACGGTKRVYDSFCKDKTGPIKRSASYWRLNCRYWSGHAKEHGWKKEPFFGAYLGSNLTAYIKVSYIRKEPGDKKCRMKISEFAHLPGEEAAIDALMAAACRFAEEHGFNKLFYDDISGINIKHSRKPRKNEYDEYWNDKYVKMYRICNFGSLMKFLSTLFSRRMRDAGIKGSWRGYIKLKRVVKNYQGRILIKLLRSRREFYMDEKKFIELVLGLKQAGKDSILKVLFPRLKPVFWDFDYL
jgi:GNAT superfamily N-acetyltransferase